MKNYVRPPTETTKPKMRLKLSYPAKFCEKAYQRLIKKRASTPFKSQGKWLAEDLIGNETVNWENTYSLPFWCSKETKLREFQFKPQHRPMIFYTIGIKQSDSCTFCEEATENLVHFFLEL